MLYSYLSLNSYGAYRSLTNLLVLQYETLEGIYCYRSVWINIENQMLQNDTYLLLAKSIHCLFTYVCIPCMDIVECEL